MATRGGKWVILPLQLAIKHSLHLGCWDSKSPFAALLRPVCTVGLQFGRAIRLRLISRFLADDLSQLDEFCMVLLVDDHNWGGIAINPLLFLHLFLSG